MNIRLRNIYALIASVLTLAAVSSPALLASAQAHTVRHKASHSRKHHAKKRSRIPQHNGGDADGDNNGGPSDGDGNI